jgi:hypothetical protein
MAVATPPSAPGAIGAFEHICLEQRGVFEGAKTKAEALGFRQIAHGETTSPALNALLPTGPIWRDQLYLDRSDAVLALAWGRQGAQEAHDRVYGCSVRAKLRTGQDKTWFDWEAALRKRWGPPRIGLEDQSYAFVGEPAAGAATSGEKARAAHKRSGADISYVDIAHGGADRVALYIRITRPRGN